MPDSESISSNAYKYLTLPEVSDEAIACQFVLRSVDKYRYVNLWGSWMHWSGARWEKDQTLRAFDDARSLCAETASLIAMDQKIAETKRAKNASAVASAQKVGAVIKLASADRLLARGPDEWDSDPWLLNTPSGTLNLRTAALHPHNPSDHITKQTKVGPAKDCPLWRELLKQWTDGDDELVAFLQRFIGYSLTGEIREHALVFFYGSGANGKSTFLSTIIEMLGDYSIVAAMETFIESKGDRHPADLAMLHGARMIVAQETEEGRRWATERIKSLTSGDRITARFMRRDFFTFNPTGKLLFAGNHRPGLRNVDEAMRRRINLVPFRVTVPEEKRDPLLLEKLRQELPGILEWALEGCIEWQQKGLAAPESVRAATADYLSDEDVLASWIEETIDRDAPGFVKVKDLHSSYQKWAQESGERFMGLKRFSQVMEDRGFERGRAPTKDRSKGFTGISMKLAIGESGKIV